MIWFDSETFSKTPIKWGSYRYTSTCELMIATYAFDDGPVHCWDRTAGEPMPGDLAYALDDDSELITAHNAMFDRNVLRYALGINVPIPRWRCSMVKALAHGLPGGLDILCAALGVPADLRKHKSGRALMHLFCKPRPKNSIIERATRETHPTEWAQFLEYAKADVPAMREVDHKLPTWNFVDSELALWHLDQKINDRGICVDVSFAEAAIAAVGREQKRLAKRTQALTNEQVQSTTQRDQLLAHIIGEYGIDLPNMQMDTLERRLNDPDLPRELHELLSIRLAASSTSTSKYSAVVRAVQDDGRVRGTLQFAGAARTRRWAGRTIQPHNYPRPDLSTEDIDFGIEAVKAKAEDLLLDDVMGLLRNACRGMIIAPPDRKLVIADLANIEGRDAAWMAGEAWKVQAFRNFDAGTGHDLYKLAYAKAFGIRPEDVNKLMRQIGKVMELMLQYGGGVGAFITGAATYGIDLDAMADAAIGGIPNDVFEEARSMWDWTLDQKRPTFGLSQHVFQVCDSLKRLWRRAHPAIESIWPALEEAARMAINHPGTTFDCSEFTRRPDGSHRPLQVPFGMFKLRRDGAWLRLRLPSGNCLCYPSPQVSENGKISYMGMNQYTKKWSRIYTYGGKIFENICQGFAGDVLKHGMVLWEEQGYETVLTVHDEGVTETPDTDDYNAPALARVMATVPSYAEGLPLAAAGFECKRYRKE